MRKLTSDIYIKTPTKESYDAIIKHIEERGYKPTESVHILSWNNYEEETVIELNETCENNGSYTECSELHLSGCQPIYHYNDFVVLESDLKGCIEGFPIQLVELMMERYFQQREVYDISSLQNDEVITLFSWETTKEGYDFWNKIWKKDFTPFYQMKPFHLSDDWCIKGPIQGPAFKFFPAGGIKWHTKNYYFLNENGYWEYSISHPLGKKLISQKEFEEKEEETEVSETFNSFMLKYGECIVSRYGSSDHIFMKTGEGLVSLSNAEIVLPLDKEIVGKKVLIEHIVKS